MSQQDCNKNYGLETDTQAKSEAVHGLLVRESHGMSHDGHVAHSAIGVHVAPQIAEPNFHNTDRHFAYDVKVFHKEKKYQILLEKYAICILS